MEDTWSDRWPSVCAREQQNARLLEREVDWWTRSRTKLRGRLQPTRTRSSGTRCLVCWLPWDPKFNPNHGRSRVTVGGRRTCALRPRHMQFARDWSLLGNLDVVVRRYLLPRFWRWVGDLCLLSFRCISDAESNRFLNH